jgi:hypothetical protein
MILTLRIIIGWSSRDTAVKGTAAKRESKIDAGKLELGRLTARHARRLGTNCGDDTQIIEVLWLDHLSIISSSV